MLPGIMYGVFAGVIVLGKMAQLPIAPKAQPAGKTELYVGPDFRCRFS